jgi:hypothetical protein
MLAEFVPEQNPLDPTTEYVEETVGLTTIKDAFDPSARTLASYSRNC